MAVDKIIDQILAKAQAESDAIIEEANKKAEEILRESETETAGLTASIKAKSDAELKGFESRIESSMDLNRRRALLAARQEVITDVLGKAYDRLDKQSDDRYFEMILKLLSKNVQPMEGKIAFSSRDMSRLPSGFEAQCNEAAKAAGGSLVLSDTPRSIENGFVLIYGDIEENCSLRALFDASRDELTDLVHGILS